MSELLRMANGLMDARAKAPEGPWKNGEYTTNAADGYSIFFDDERLSNSSEFIVYAENHAVDVIKGYQRLVEAALSLLEHAHFTREWRQLETVADLWMTEAREAIPGASDSQEQSNEES